MPPFYLTECFYEDFLDPYLGLSLSLSLSNGIKLLYLKLETL